CQPAKAGRAPNPPRLRIDLRAAYRPIQSSFWLRRPARLPTGGEVILLRQSLDLRVSSIRRLKDARLHDGGIGHGSLVLSLASCTCPTHGFTGIDILNPFAGRREMKTLG